MKRILQIFSLALVVMLGSSLAQKALAQPGYDDGYDGGYYEGGDDRDVSYQTFYDELSPHGRWIQYPEYGYVWAPNIGRGFRPYETGGRWVWTDSYDWMWVSDYSWGWAPFHYGRWFQDPYYGWMWVPGYEWSPAWVAWRDGGDYYGWAPLRPGINISINIGLGGYNPPMDYWVFAPRRYITSPRIYSYCVPRSRNVTIINNTTIINNYNRRNNVFIGGPRRMDAERYAGRINPVRFRETSRPGRSRVSDNQVSVFRPRIDRNNRSNSTPRNFERYDRSSQRDNVFNRGNDNRVSDRNRSNDVFRRSQEQNRDQNTRRNVFDRSNRNSEVRPQQQDAGNNRENQRRNIFNRGNEQPSNNERNMRRPFEQRNEEVRQQPAENNNRVFERRNQEQAQRNTRRPFEQRNNEVRQQSSDNNRSFERRSQQQQQRSVNRPFEQRNNAEARQPRGNDNNQSPRMMERVRPSNENRGQGNNDNNSGRRFGRR